MPRDRAETRRELRLIQEAASADAASSAVANPLLTLLEVADEALLWKDELKRRVVLLQEDQWRYPSAAGEQIRGDIVLYERSIERLARILVMIAKLGIEERLTRVTEQQARLVERAVTAALADIGLEVSKQDEAREAVARHLRLAGS